MTNPGIYSISNKRNGKVYIGSAVNLRQRFFKHRHDLRKGNHHSIKLQNAWNKYGPDAFSFDVIETINDKENLASREQFWIDQLKAATRANYNILPTAYSRLGSKHTKKTKAKISKSRTGITPIYSNPEEKNRKAAESNKIPEEKRAEIIALFVAGEKQADIAAAAGVCRHTVRWVVAGIKRDYAKPRKKYPPVSNATKQKMRESHIGKKQSTEQVEKRAAKLRGHVCSPETRAKIAAKATGRKMSPEAVEKMASTHRGIKQSAEHIGKRTAKIRGKKMAPGVGFKRWETRRAKDEALSASLF